MSSNIKIKKICLHCSQEFIARTTVTKYCGDNCAKGTYKARVWEQKIQLSKEDLQNPEIKTKFKQTKDSYFELNTIDYITVIEVVTLLKCDRRTIYRLIKSGRLASGNLSIRRTRILKKD
ncbi:helix-turn-helix domain-containing protein [Chryseobacterium sp. LAM-KRS1]|uniref:helix-turn-helix domain-containing protein n=1 Tax=Chryseobacterium sp. LAM-KRS1 TaxID=2715754 RepID=UPI00155759AF|nr:helix-turn-helix domain-containing protein [Chryseobacterium sp. LAM-KRS1]